MRAVCVILVLMPALTKPGTAAPARPPVPDRLVVLTFDDSLQSHFTVVREILLKHGFGATFFITEGFDFSSNKRDYMTWEQIAQLHHDGFEIGNHTRDHWTVDGTAPDLQDRLREQIETLNDHCEQYGIPRPVSFAWPGNATAVEALPLLRELGIRFARRGGSPEFPYDEGQGCAWEPGLDHPLLIPSAGDARPDWTLDDFRRAVDQARHGRLAVLQFHGVPDTAHSWVSTPADRFRLFMQYLADHDFTVIALKDAARYVDPNGMPRDPGMVIRDRQRHLAAGGLPDNTRKPESPEDLRRWLENMVWYHRYSPAEIGAATGLSRDQIAAALTEFGIRPDNRPTSDRPNRLLVLPYPGGRHPRIGFRDGAIRPQRDTKLSVFSPWNDSDYFVLDLPEAIRRNDEARHGLLYLAHTHVDTMWTRQNIRLQPVEWQRRDNGDLVSERTLPNGVRFGTRVSVTPDGLQMNMWLHNGSDEWLRDLRVQNCVLLGAAPEFAGREDDASVLRRPPYIARKSHSADRWIITAWSPCERTWFNPPCPCLHSDGRFPDCPPGETQFLSGWLSFYEGDRIDEELRRIDARRWDRAASEN